MEEIIEQKKELEPSDTTQILVVDDDVVVRTLNARFLGGLADTQVVSAEDGQAGLEVFTEMGGKLDFVMSDNSMPRMTGEEMLSKMKEINPDLFAVLASGDVDLDEKIEGMLEKGINVVLKKPTTPEQLLEVLSQAKEWKKARESKKGGSLK